MKNIVAILAGITLVFGINVLSFAMDCGDMSGGHGSKAQASSKEAVNVGNKICPVIGEKIDEKTKATIEYKGKVYNLCCPMCEGEFKKDPEKYIKKIEEEK